MTLYRRACTQILTVVVDVPQVTSENAGRDPETWLPAHLRPYCKVIVTTLIEESPVIPSLYKLIFGQLGFENLFLDMTRLPYAEGRAMAARHLQLAGRTVTEAQMGALMEGFAGCPTPLYMKLAARIAARWTSYTGAKETVLPPTMRGIFAVYMQALEKTHGRTLVAHALGCVMGVRLACMHACRRVSLPHPLFIMPACHLGWASPSP